MTDQSKPIFNKLLFSGIILFLILLMQPLEVFYFIKDIPILFPKGIIGLKQRDLLLLIQAIMLVFIIPVYAFTFIFSWWYRADNEKSKYDPELTDNTLAEVVWWGLPLVFTIFIAVITWIKTHELDPYRPIESDKKALDIEVVALDWKWLFIYPEEKIATINDLHIPVDRPVHFFITADAPMNSFWIPSLGGQIYAMAGMQTQLYLMANEEGSFLGRSSQISGEGFSGMTFMTEATSDEDYANWVEEVKQSEGALNWETYTVLREQTKNVPPQQFRLEEEGIFKKIIDKFMDM